jgi:DNA-binding transcriptional MocR family regulator
MSVPVLNYPIAGRRARAIADSVEAALRAGRLAPGAGLPTVRALAGTLGVSPATVAAAYRTLRERGLIAGAGRRGTRVTQRPPLSTPAPARAPAHLVDLSDGNPDPRLLPSLSPALARLPRQQRLYGEPANRPRLLELAARQLGADGIPVTSLAVVGGALDGIERVLQAHLRPGDRVAVEDPGYSGVLDLVAALGLVAEPVALDDLGPVPGSLRRALQGGALAAIVTPRAQNPTGAALDERRARELRGLLDQWSGVLVVEDDHAGPVAGARALTLCRGNRERWAVVRSVAKSLGPDLRLAVLTGDAGTVARVEGRQRIGTGWVSHLLQATVEALWSREGTEARLAAAAATYAERRQALLHALARRGIAANGRSGMNVWVPVPDEAAAVAGLAEAGFAVRAGERYRLRSAPAIRVTTARLSTRDAERVADALARTVAPALRRTHST